MGDLTFGFKMRVRKRATVHLETKAQYGDIHELEITLTNNTDMPMEGALVFHSDTISMLDRRCRPVTLSTCDFVCDVIRFRGVGRGRLTFGGEEKDVSLFDTVAFISTKKKIESYFWIVSEGSIHVRLLDMHVYPELHIDGFVLGMNDKEIPWTYRDDMVETRVSFSPRGSMLRMDITVLAKKDMRNRRLGIVFWSYFPSLSDSQIAIPVHDDKIVVERPIHNVFPRLWSFIRHRLPKPWVGMIYNEYALRYVFPETAEFTFLSPWGGFKIDLPLDLRQGELGKCSIILETIPRRELTRYGEICRAIEVRQRDLGHVYIKNNWIHELEVRIDGDATYRGIIRPSEEKKLLEPSKGFGHLDLLICMDVCHERRKIPYVRPIGMAENTTYGALELEHTSLGGALKSLKLDGKELLFWSNEPIKTPLRIPIVHGGLTLELVVDGEMLGLPTTKWEKRGPNKYTYETKKIATTRRWFLLDEESILEEIIIENASNMPRKVELREDIIMLGHGDIIIGDDEIYLQGKPYVVQSKRHVWVKTDIVALAYVFIRHKQATTTVEAATPIDFYPYIENRTLLSMKPRQKIKMWSIISLNMEKTKRLISAI